MKRRFTRLISIGLKTCASIGVLGAGFTLKLVEAQNKKPNPHYYPTYAVSSSVRPIVTAVGDRVQRAGHERIILTGSLNRKGSVSTLQIIRELPGLLRTDEVGGKNKTLVYDLTSLKGSSAVDNDDEDLAESIDDDSVEAFLARFGPRASVRHLGDRFKVKGQTGFGSELDIYEVVAPIDIKHDKSTVAKRYMFDTNTGLLRRVLYPTKQSGKTVIIETLLSNYSSTTGYSLPGRISRLADGAEAFVFTLTGATVMPALADTAFTSTGR